MEKAKKSTLEEMYDILHPPEEKEVIVAACRECTLILHDISKYCPECGAITELGRATRALEKLGEGEEKVDSAGLISIGFETSPGTALDLNSTGIWQPSAMTTTLQKY